MATIDQLLNDIDEFEDWPLGDDNNASEDSRGSVEVDTNAQTDLVECVLRCSSAK